MSIEEDRMEEEIADIENQLEVVKKQVGINLKGLAVIRVVIGGCSSIIC